MLSELFALLTVVYTGINKPQSTVSKVTHSSTDTVGSIQYDSLRPICGYLGNLQWATGNSYKTDGYQNSGNVFHYVAATTRQSGASSFPVIQGTNRPTPYILSNISENGTTSNLTEPNNSYWYNALTKYSYDLKSETSTDENGNRFVSRVWLEQSEIHPTLFFQGQQADVAFDVESAMPVTNEIRPANVAVKFMIKAK